jgi:hypothetical protein
LKVAYKGMSNPRNIITTPIWAIRLKNYTDPLSEKRSDG